MQQATHNAADPKKVKRAAIKERLLDEQKIKDVFVVMSTREGRRFMWRLINELCRVDNTEFISSGSLAYYHNGERNIGRIVKADIYEASVEAYQLMEKENWEFLRKDNSNGR